MPKDMLKWSLCFLHPGIPFFSSAKISYIPHSSFFFETCAAMGLTKRQGKIQTGLHTENLHKQGTQFFSLNKSVSQKLSAPIMWLTLGQQIFPCLPIAICLSFFSYSFHSLFQTCVATYVPRKESLKYPLYVWWNGRLNGARENTISSYSHFCFLLTSFSLKFIPFTQKDV